MIIHEIETYGPQGKGDMNATYKIVIMDAGNHHKLNSTQLTTPKEKEWFTRGKKL